MVLVRSNQARCHISIRNLKASAMLIAASLSNRIHKRDHHSLEETHIQQEKVAVVEEESLQEEKKVSRSHKGIQQRRGLV